MANNAGPSARVHLWGVGALAMLWSGFGAFDYLMTQTGSDWWLSRLSAGERTYLASFPVWLNGSWAIGVWGGVLGALLLLARSRHTVHAFAASLVAMVFTFAYQFFATEIPESRTEGARALMPVVVMAIGLGLLLYARIMRGKGVLR